jgi:sec-independent protein translocase protein TatA
MISPGTLTLTAIIAALVFGTKRLRHIGEDLGAALRSFRKGLQTEDEQAVVEPAKQPHV